MPSSSCLVLKYGIEKDSNDDDGDFSCLPRMALPGWLAPKDDDDDDDEDHDDDDDGDFGCLLRMALPGWLQS